MLESRRIQAMVRCHFPQLLPPKQSSVQEQHMSAVAVRGTNSLCVPGYMIYTHIQEEVFAKLSVTCSHLKYKYSRVSFCNSSFYDHFYDPCPVGPSTPDSCITVATQASFLYLTHFSFPVCMCFFFFYSSAVLLSWMWFFHPWHPSKRQKIRKNQNSWHYILSWCLLYHGLGLLQQKSDLIFFFNYLCFFDIPSSLN